MKTKSKRDTVSITINPALRENIETLKGYWQRKHPMLPLADSEACLWFIQSGLADTLRIWSRRDLD